MAGMVHEIVAGYDGSPDTCGRGGLRGMVLGWVSLAILHYAHCPVSVIRER
jgi:nucleotide-binding universal stress UspA family protein